MYLGKNKTKCCTCCVKLNCIALVSEKDKIFCFSILKKQINPKSSSILRTNKCLIKPSKK